MDEATGGARENDGSAPAAPARDRRFDVLPEPVAPEDYVLVQAVDPPQDPTMGRDSEKDFMLRHA